MLIRDSWIPEWSSGMLTGDWRSIKCLKSFFFLNFWFKHLNWNQHFAETEFIEKVPDLLILVRQVSIVAHDLGLVGGVVGPLITRAERVSSLVFGTAILLVWRLDLGMQSFSSVIDTHVFFFGTCKTLQRNMWKLLGSQWCNRDVYIYTWQVWWTCQN